MKDTTRRLVLFLVIIVAGSIMIFVDIPVFYLLAGVIVLGILLLFLTGAIRLPSIKKTPKGEKKAKPDTKEKKAKGGKKEKKEKPGREERKAKKLAAKKEREATKGSKRGISEVFSSIAGAFSVLKRDFSSASRSGKDQEAKHKKIDEMLDKSILGDEEVSLDDIVPEAAPVQKKKGVDDPFSELAQDSIKIEHMEDIEADFDDISLLDDEGLDVESFGMETQVAAEGTGTEDFSKMDINLDQDEEPIAIDEEEDEEVDSILKAHQAELEEDGDEEGEDLLSGDLGEMDGIDLDSIEMDEELSEGIDEDEDFGPEISGGAAKAAPASGTQPAPKPEPELAMPKEDDMIAFGSGRRQDDDLMASLKSDVKGVKKEENISLLRDLKDVKVPAGDLEKELEGLLKISRRKE